VSLDVNQLLLDSAREMDEVSNAEVREGAVEDRWNSWQHELSTMVSEAALGTAEKPALPGQTPPPGAAAKKPNKSK